MTQRLSTRAEFCRFSGRGQGWSGPAAMSSCSWAHGPCKATRPIVGYADRPPPAAAAAAPPPSNRFAAALWEISQARSALVRCPSENSVAHSFNP